MKSARPKNETRKKNKNRRPKGTPGGSPLSYQILLNVSNVNVFDFAIILKPNFPTTFVFGVMISAEEFGGVIFTGRRIYMGAVEKSMYMFRRTKWFAFRSFNILQFL
jgi:hypothetical protein